MIEVVHIAEPLLVRLHQQGHLKTRVHSVFQSACNLTDGRGLIAVLGPNKSMNPCAIMVDEPHWFSTLTPGQPISIIFSGHTSAPPTHTSLSVCEKAVQVFHPYLPDAVFREPVPVADIARHLYRHHTEAGIYSLLARCDALSLLPGTGYYAEPMAQFFMPRLHAFIDAVSAQDTGITLKGFVGFGAGLTPSSDDLLVGLLSWLDYTEHPYFSVLAEACHASLPGTTAVSATMLSLTTNHTYNADIIDVYHALNGTRALIPALNSLLSYGHSSGHDTLCGIYIGMCLFPLEPK